MLLSMLRDCDYNALRFRSGKFSENEILDQEARQPIREKSLEHEGVGSAPVHIEHSAAQPAAPAATAQPQPAMVHTESRT